MTKTKKEEVEADCLEKKGFEIDWDSVMDKEEDEVPELEIVNSKPPPPSLLSDDHIVSQSSLTDRDLNEQLERIKTHLVNFGPNLHDKGEKIRLRIASLEEEKQRRIQQRSNMYVGRSSKLMQSIISGSDVYSKENAASKYTSKQGNTAFNDTSKQGNAESNEVSRSTFAAYFSKPKMDTESKKAFGKELEDLGCESRNPKADKKPITKRRMLSDIGKTEHCGNQFSSGLNGSKGNKKSKLSYGRKKPKESSSYSLLDDDDYDPIAHETPREWSWEEYPSEGSRHHRKRSDDTVINVDEEELQPATVEKEAVELPQGLQEEICYPSRDDPHFVQVCLKDLECLAPQEFLTSPVMNFYIRFVQQQLSSSDQISADCHFFNTYFYKKLNEAVTYKGNDKDAFFVKFRRWWKGIDLFRKAYIFIPIHEDLHWSLVIVCIPDKKDESELTILHLDSLGLHSKRSIVENVKRFLKDEWHYLNQGDYSLDLPISGKVWKSFPRRIREADIQVPQQKNDFDCGPFVLFFIKRFIEEAPPRLKRKDLRMFHRKWFRPDEASALRIEILNTLIELFRVSEQTDHHNDQTVQISTELFRVSEQTEHHNDQTVQTSTDNAASNSRNSSPL